MVGAGFAGLSVAWHLLNVTSYLFFFFFFTLSFFLYKTKTLALTLIDINNGEQSSGKDLGLRIDIFDEVGIGGGASGVSGGLLHPYSPKGTITYQSSSLHSTLCSFVITFFSHYISILFFLLFTSYNLLHDFHFFNYVNVVFRHKAYILSKIKNFG